MLFNIRRRCAIILCITLAGAGPAGAATARDTAALRDCNAYVIDKDRKIAACTVLINQGGSAANRAMAYFKRGEMYHSKDDHDRAIADFTEVVRLDPTDKEAYHKRGVSYIFRAHHGSKDDYDRAIADLETSLRLGYDRKWVLIWRASAYEGRNELGRALADYEEVVRIDPKDASNHGYVVRMQRERGEYDRAIEAVERALKLKPKDAFYLTTRGDIYADKGDHDRAFQDFAQAIRLAPKDWSPYARRADLHYARGETERAFSDINKAMQLYNWYFLHVTRGDMYRNLGDFDRALRDFDEALRRAKAENEKRPSLYRSRGIAHLYAGDAKKAWLDFKQAHEDYSKWGIEVLWAEVAAKRAGMPSLLPEAEAKLDLGIWPAPLIFLFQGKMTPDQVTQIAQESSAPHKRRTAVCEAHFFIGQWELARGDKDAARNRFRSAVAECIKSPAGEWGPAAFELKAMGEVN